MASIFIFDSDLDRVRSIYDCLASEGHEVHSNMGNIRKPVSNHEVLRPSRAVRMMWDRWLDLPDIIITDCFDVDCEHFLEILHTPFFKKNVSIIVMTPTSKRKNSLVHRLMQRFNAFCIPRPPFELNKFMKFVQELPVSS